MHSLTFALYRILWFCSRHFDRLYLNIHWVDLETRTDNLKLRCDWLTISLHFDLETRSGFQTDTSKLRCDWLAISRSWLHWLRAPSSQKQFENPPQTHSFIFSLYLNSILLRPKNSKIVPHSSFGFLIRFSPSLICISLLFDKHCDLTVRSTEFTCTMCYVF